MCSYMLDCYICKEGACGLSTDLEKCDAILFSLCTHEPSSHVHNQLTHVSHDQFYFCYLIICAVMEWLCAHGPNLIQQDPIAPHIASNWVLAVVEGLRGSPLHRDLSTMRNIEVFLLEFSWKTKVCNLCRGSGQKKKLMIIYNSECIKDHS